MDKTYIRVGGRWCYLYRAITAGGQTLDFYLSPKRNVAAAKRFLAKALRSNTSAGYPRVINTDKAPSLARAIAELKSEGICPPTVEHRQVKYLNNILEGDHGRLKRILGPKGAFKNLDICISLGPISGRLGPISGPSSGSVAAAPRRAGRRSPADPGWRHRLANRGRRKRRR
ncbi:hypothetical protein H924_02150 [Corynebacterium callunae DSM 20147]|uniref:DDE domain-containing protein n=1 Tax=Corynebacterium callunae DSM 20147 TaxID=1121353 RepID=M1UJA6_9CORY|nr:hypothetical protein H924_02150 [Corynebacterium callunae DSM 20147]